MLAQLDHIGPQKGFCGEDRTEFDQIGLQSLADVLPAHGFTRRIETPAQPTLARRVQLVFLTDEK